MKPKFCDPALVDVFRDDWKRFRLSSIRELPFLGYPEHLVLLVCVSGGESIPSSGGAAAIAGASVFRRGFDGYGKLDEYVFRGEHDPITGLIVVDGPFKPRLNGSHYRQVPMIDYSAAPLLVRS